MLPYATTPMLTNGVQQPCQVVLMLLAANENDMGGNNSLAAIDVETDAFGIELKKHKRINVVKDQNEDNQSKSEFESTVDGDMGNNPLGVDVRVGGML